MLKQLAGQTAIYGLGTIVPRFLNYLLFPYLTRVMTVGEYGVVTDLYALIPFVLVLLTMGLETGYFRFAGKAGSEAEKRTIFSNVWGVVTAVSIVFFVLALLFTPQLARVMEYTDHPSYIRLVAAIVMLNTVTAIPLARLRQQGRAKRFMILRLLFVIVNLALTFFFYSGLPGLAELGICASWYDPQYGAGYVLLADLLANIVLLFALIPDFRNAMPRIRWRQLRTILAYSFPLLVSGIAGVSNQFIDRQMIKYLVPAGAMAQLGVYGAITKIAVVMMLFTQMYRLAAEPFFLADYRKSDFVAMNAAAMKYYVMASMFIFLGIALFKDLFSLIVGADFREGIFILPVVLGANVLSGVWLNLSFWYKREERTQLAVWVTFTGLFFTVVMNVALVPALGYVGAAWARLASEAAMVGVSYWLNRRYYPTPYDLRRIGEYVALGLGVFFASAVFARWLPVRGAEYAVNGVLFGLFGLFAVRREHIDVGRLLRSVVKR